MKIRINDADLYVNVQGQLTEHALPVIAHHGAPGFSSHDEPMNAFRALADTHPIISYDARGSGISDYSPPYTHEQWVSDMDALREHFGIERFILSGGSYGGYIALEYAIRHPERVSHIILRDTCARDYSFMARENARKRAAEFPDITEEVLDQMFHGTYASNEEYIETFKIIAPLYDVNFDADAWDARMRSANVNIDAHNYAFSVNKPNYDVREQLRSLNIPVLITVGRHDWICPLEASEEMHSLLPDSELAVFEHSGHSPQKEENDLWIATIRDFLTRHGAYAAG